MKKHFKIYQYIILFLVADWFNIATTVLPGFGSLNVRIGDFLFTYLFILYFRYIFNKNVKKTFIHYFYILFLLGNIVPIYLGTQNTQLSYALRDFQVISLSVAFFVGLFVINDLKDIKKILSYFVIAFVFRELFLLFTLGPRDGYLNRIIALADTSQTSYIQNLAIFYFLYKYLTIKNSLSKIIYLSLILYLTITLLALGKMGGILSLFIGLIIILKYSLSKINFIKFTFILLLFGIILVYIGGHEYIQNSFTRMATIERDIDLDANSQWRLLAWEQGLQVFEGHIFTGGGYSWPNGWLIVPLEYGPESVWGTMLHNEYLHILSSGGIVNFCVFLLFIIYILKYFVRKIKLINNYNDKIFSSILFASFASFIITGLTNPAWTFFVSMVGWAFGSFGYRYVQLTLKENNAS